MYRGLPRYKNTSACYNTLEAHKRRELCINHFESSFVTDFTFFSHRTTKHIQIIRYVCIVSSYSSRYMRSLNVLCIQSSSHTLKNEFNSFSKSRLCKMTFSKSIDFAKMNLIHFSTYVLLTCISVLTNTHFLLYTHRCNIVVSM